MIVLDYGANVYLEVFNNCYIDGKKWKLVLFP